MAVIPRITVYGRSPDAPPDDFQRVADDMGGFTRGDATQGFSRLEGPTGAPEGSPALAPTPAAPEPVPNNVVAEGFTRLGPAAQQAPMLPDDQPPQVSGTPWFDKMLEPITSYPATQRRMAGEAVEQMKTGIGQIGTKVNPDTTKGVFNTALGALNYTFSPINAAAHTIVGKPLEENTGLPHQYSEFATTLALPVVGFGKVPKGVQKIFSPETVSQEAMDAAALIRQRSGIAARDTETTAAQLEHFSKPVSELPTGWPSQAIETLGPAAVRARGEVFTGPIHATAYEDALNKLVNLGKVDEGWVTSTGRFVDRKEASVIADRAGQLNKSMGRPGESMDVNYLKAGEASTRAAPDTQLGIMHYIEGTGTAPSTPQLRALADTLKQSFAERLAKLQALPQHAQMAFVEDYFPHFWKNPALAQSIVTSGGFMKQGSGASLKARTVPTIEDGIKQGLEPLTTNPIDATMHYVTSMDKFIASQEILNTAIRDGTVIYRRPTVMGASGHSNSLKGVPPGYVALTGRGSKDAMGATAYAPEDWARVYNNYLSKGWADVGEEYGNAYAHAQRGANAVTQTLLSFSGYHAFTMAEAGMSNQIAKAVEAINAGHPFDAAKEFAKTPFAPVSYAAKGAKLRDVYLGKLAARSPEEKEIVDLITQAGGRMSKQPKLADYDASALGDYLTAFRRGKLAAEFKAQGADIAAAPIGGALRTAASNIGRIMDTFNKPLFQHYIPMMKNAAAAENLAQWIKLNPTASQAEKLAAARRVVDSVDNRFGEMIQDNIFWNKIAKQSAMLAMLSYSWNVGGWREIGGGVRDIARAGTAQGGWTPKASYAVAMALNWALMSAVYQGVKTGQAPKDIHDLVAPRTGGTDVRTGQPERIIPPGIMKDVFGYYEHFGQEVLNKLNPGARIAGQSLSILGGQGGSDWRGDPILSPKGPGESAMSKVPDWLAEYFSFVIKGVSPIQSQQLGRGPEQGSALNPLELALGIRKAPRQLTDPEGYEIMLNRMHRDAWRRKLMHDRKESERYGGGSE